MPEAWTEKVRLRPSKLVTLFGELTIAGGGIGVTVTTTGGELVELPQWLEAIREYPPASPSSTGESVSDRLVAPGMFTLSLCHWRESAFPIREPESVREVPSTSFWEAGGWVKTGTTSSISAMTKALPAAMALKRFGKNPGGLATPRAPMNQLARVRSVPSARL